MKVLFLGPADSPLIPYLEERDEVTVVTDPLDASRAAELGPDWAVSYGYRHILRPDVLDALGGRAINLHIAYLPWNRGADPNLWSAVEGTPAGVSIHYIDEGVDTGDLIAQRRVELNDGDTLETSYTRLQHEIQDLFREVWPLVREGRAPRSKQPPGGSYHALADRIEVEHLLTDGWNTPLASLAARREQ